MIHIWALTNLRHFEYTDNREYENNMQLSTLCPISFRASLFLSFTFWKNKRLQIQLGSPGSFSQSYSSLSLPQTNHIHEFSGSVPSLHICILTSVHWKDWCWGWNYNTLATWCEELTHLKRPWCWERLKAGGEGDNRGWDGWMVSLTQWTWTWVNSGSWWWTGRPSVLRSMGLQRVGHNWVTELNWIESL